MKLIKANKMLTLCSDSNKFDTFLGNELKSLIKESDLVDSKFNPLLSGGELLSTDDLEEFEQCHAITEVLVDLLDLDPNLPQVGIAPGCECLQNK